MFHGFIICFHRNWSSNLQQRDIVWSKAEVALGNPFCVITAESLCKSEQWGLQAGVIRPISGLQPRLWHVESRDSKKYNQSLITTNPKHSVEIFLQSFIKFSAIYSKVARHRHHRHTHMNWFSRLPLEFSLSRDKPGWKATADCHCLFAEVSVWSLQTSKCASIRYDGSAGLAGLAYGPRKRKIKLMPSRLHLNKAAPMSVR